MSGIWKIRQIFDGEYGCEERVRPRLSVTLHDASGNQCIRSVTEQWLAQRGLTEGSEWPEYSHIFFDLDGTLTKSEFGVIDSVIYALRRMGIEEENRESLKRFIGPPLFESFREFYQMSEADADRAVAYYREIYEAEGIYQSPLYEGVEEMLDALKKAGKHLVVVTSKPDKMAEKVLSSLKIRTYFDGVAAPENQDRHSDKSVLIGKALQMCGLRDGSAAIMVGDRHFDIDGAVTAGIDSVGVLYGYGSLDELEGAGASFLAESPAGLVELLRNSLLGVC